MRESLLQLEDLGVLEGRYRAVLFRIEALEMSFAGVYYELPCSALLTHHSDKVLAVLPLIEIVNT